MVTTTFAADTVFFVDLPEASPAVGVRERKQISIAVSSSGEIAVDNEPVTIEGLRANLELIPKERRNRIPVIVRADKQSRHGVVVAVIDVVRQLGLENIGIATQVPVKK